MRDDHEGAISSLFFYCFLCVIALNGPLTIEKSADQ
jgi:hypothetical protein